MKKLKFNQFGDCIVDENDRIVAERPARMREWPEAEEIVRAFNRPDYPDTEADGFVFCGKCGKMNTA
jgi:hypothetical protein